MKRITVMLLAVATLAVATIGCNNAGGSGDPKAVLMAFSEKLGKKDFEGAKALATKESAPVIDMMQKVMKMAEKFAGMVPAGQEKQHAKFDDVKIGEPRIEGNFAYLPLTSSGSETIEYVLKNEGGAWKVDFTESTMNKMGMNVKDLEEAEKGMKEMDNMNLDSLTKGMEGMEGMKDMMKPENLKKMQEQAKEMQKMGEDAKKQIESMKQ